MHATKPTLPRKKSSGVPAPIGARLTRRVREIAIAAFRAVDCAGMARVDFFIENGRAILNEINTIPGFTPISMFPRLWQLAGMTYRELITRLVDLGLSRFRQREALGA